ncbi:MAG: hypothetical protein JST75_05275 [Bacteroidetes bacterium]|nr:hypothetical protein [Bacteroidota bacterium]
MKPASLRISSVLIFLFASTLTHAQNLTGIWRGHFRSNEAYQRLFGDDDRYKMEVQVAQEGRKFEAVTYSYKTTVFYGKAEATGSLDQVSKKVLLRELKIVELRMSLGDACIMTCFLQYSKLGDEEFLEGRYTSMNTRDSSDCGKGSIFLHKVPETDFYKEPFLEKKEKQIREEKKKPVTPPAVNKSEKINTPPPVAKKTDPPKTTNTKKTTNTTATTTVKKTKPAVKTAPQKELAKIDPGKHQVETYKPDTATKIEKKSFPLVTPKVLATRSNEVVKSITVANPEITLNVYDDGAIDNDTVSIYFDKKLIVSKARLTDRAITVKLHLEESSEPHELVMVAENLGDIPPNTSLLTVKAGEKRYEVRIVSTEQKNAVVLFKYEKPE